MELLWICTAWAWTWARPRLCSGKLIKYIPTPLTLLGALTRLKLIVCLKALEDQGKRAQPCTGLSFLLCVLSFWSKNAVVTTASQCPETEGYQLITQVKDHFSLGEKAIILVAASDLWLLVSVPLFRSSFTADMVPQLQHLHMYPDRQDLRVYFHLVLEKA